VIFCKFTPGRAGIVGVSCLALAYPARDCAEDELRRARINTPNTAPKKAFIDRRGAWRAVMAMIFMATRQKERKQELPINAYRSLSMPDIPTS